MASSFGLSRPHREAFQHPEEEALVASRAAAGNAYLIDSRISLIFI
jgi:hypothetical protein